MAVVCVDDTDTSIKWDGPWFNIQENVDDWGNGGPPFLGTLKGITTNGSLTFTFRGRRVGVFGSLRPRNISEGSGHDPDWECFVDGVSKGQPYPYPQEPYSNFPLCALTGESDSNGRHTLELKAVIHGETLWVDQIQYIASPGVDLSNAWTEVAARGPGGFNYSGDWKEDADNYYGWSTKQNGASFTYDFNGQGVIFGGYTQGDAAALDGQGTYSLDGSTPEPFSIPATPKGKSRQPYFKILTMDPGPHRLKVINLGNESTTALSLSYIYTKNSPALTSQSGKTRTIIGAAVGGGSSSKTLQPQLHVAQHYHPLLPPSSLTLISSSHAPPLAMHVEHVAGHINSQDPALQPRVPLFSSSTPGEEREPEVIYQGTPVRKPRDDPAVGASRLRYLQAMDGKPDENEPPPYTKGPK
ncbi:hypothetical protein NMY22_g11222 [Coprinellus aureogranulatus]|nr:hypothetical protein NMY22_g11222 [Coprinellus aureogranulatus]